MQKKILRKKELAQLKRKGFTSFQQHSGQYHIVCVGPFYDKSHATQAQKKLVKMYKDCFFKKNKIRE